MCSMSSRVSSLWPVRRRGRLASVHCEDPTHRAWGLLSESDGRLLRKEPGRRKDLTSHDFRPAAFTRAAEDAQPASGIFVQGACSSGLGEGY